jgi:hypothetical protein
MTGGRQCRHMLLHDHALIDGPARITREGHFVAKARVARANNVQDYFPHELELPPKADGSPYRIFRPAAEIFARDSLASALHRPIVVDHPKEDVTAANWKALSVGDTGGDVLRDGELMSIPVMVMDAAGVKKIQTTHPEFSWGYSAEIDMTPGKFGDAKYDGSLKHVRYNHLAMCGRARGGSDLRVTDSLVILDERPPHLRDHQEQPMKIKIGDAEVDLSDGAAVAVAIGSLNAKMDDAATRATTAEAALATANTSIVAKDAEIVTLKDQVEKAKVTPQQMRDAAKAYAVTVGKAKALGVTVTDAMDEPAIKRAVVDKAMGDAAKDYTDADVTTAFAVLTKDAKVQDSDPLRTVIANQSVNVGDAEARRNMAHENMIRREQGLPELKTA